MILAQKLVIVSLARFMSSTFFSNYHVFRAFPKFRRFPIPYYNNFIVATKVASIL